MVKSFLESSESLRSLLVRSRKKNTFNPSNGNKLSFNSKIQNEFRLEPYLKIIKNVKQRVAVNKMSICSHLLPIETGRLTGRYQERREFVHSVSRLLETSFITY